MEEYLEQLKSDEAFYARIASNLAEVESFPISPEEKKRIWFQIYETAQRYEEGKIADEKNEKQIKKLRESLESVASSFCSIMEYGVKITEGVEKIAISQKEVLREVNQTNENIQNSIRIANECGKNLEDAKMYMEDAKDSTKRTGKKIKEVEKTISKIKKETEEIENGYESKLDAKQTVIDILNGMKNKNPGFKEGFENEDFE